MKAWEQNPDPEASIDCCIAHVFSWGHTVGASFHRRSAEYDFPEQAPELPPSWQHLPPDQTFPQPPYICQDFHIRAAERHKRWTNSDLWLFDTDCDWHMPLFFTVREMTQRAKRIRTKERQMARKAVQRTRQAEKAASSFSGRTGPPTQSQGPPSWTNRSDEHKKKIRRNKRMRKLPTCICIVIVYQSNSQHRRSHLRPYGQNTLRVISHQRYCDVFRSFFRGQNHLRSSTCPKLLSQCLCQTITITYTNPVYQGPPSRPASPEPRTPTEPFEPADPTVTTKAKPPPPKYSPGEAGNYFPSRPPSRQHAYKTPPETQPVYTANPSPQATPIRPNPRGNPPRQYGPNQPFSPRGQYYQQAPSQPVTP